MNNDIYNINYEEIEKYLKGVVVDNKVDNNKFLTKKGKLDDEDYVYMKKFFGGRERDQKILSLIYDRISEEDFWEVMETISKFVLPDVFITSFIRTV